MSKVIFDISMSLDGFVTASNRTYDEPMGEGGERLHEWGLKAWAGEDPRNLEFFERSVAGLGASIAGRRTYDDSIRYWGEGALERIEVVDTDTATHLRYRVLS